MKNVILALFALAASSAIANPFEDGNLLDLAKREAQAGSCPTCTRQFPNGGFPGQGPTSCDQVKKYRGLRYVCEPNYGYVTQCRRGREVQGQREYCSQDLVCTAAIDGSDAFCNE